ncbi:MAG: M3 family oligoendopeptidase [Desulfobulbaceae bacterium]|nr:M3 family oligoendopeptidase [Desulfobulbaceae bacterium]
MNNDTIELLAGEIIWNLQDLYSGPEAEELTADINKSDELATSLSAEFKGKVAELDDDSLYKLVQQLEGLEKGLAKLETYVFLNFTTQTHDAAASALVQKVEELGARVGAQTVFFQLEWNLLDDKRAAELLQSERLNKYRHYLTEMRKFAVHQLSPLEEQLLQEIAPVGRSAWLMLFEKVMGAAKFGPDGRSEEEVLSELYADDREVRKQAAEDLTDGLEKHKHILTHIFNTLAADKMIIDGKRGYLSWISKMNLENELADETVDTLVDTVIERYDIVHSYYRLKKNVLGLEELCDYDRYAPVPGLSNTSISWEECRSIVLDGFAEFSPRMAEIGELFFSKNWIHAPVLEGKRGGAFAHPCVPEVHPYVMVNYTGNLRDVSTVAHELGHGIHQHLAAEQGFYNSNTTLVLAETASVFAELLVFKAQRELIKDPAGRRAFTCQKLESIFATVFRQVSMNRFEHAMHTTRRSSGELSADTLSTLWVETQRPMFGNSVTLTDNYGVWWSYIPHFLGTPGYVYSYAFGELLVLALYARYLEEGEGFVEKYLNLLSAGGVDTPYNLLRSFDINLDDPNFWHGGLSVIEQMLKEVE